jgi:hypothetical protein
MRKMQFILWIALVSVLLAACGGAAPTAVPTQDKPSTAVPVDTQAPAPENTITQTCTASPIPSATFTLPSPPTVTTSPIPLPDFANARVVVSEVRLDNRAAMLLGMDIPGLNGVYNVTLGTTRFVCQTDSKRPERLWCDGPTVKLATNEVEIAFYPVGVAEPVYQGVYLILLTIPTAMPVGDLSTWCPDRGKDVYCETEWRYKPNGDKCQIATCTDACGYYYSEACVGYDLMKKP